MRGKTYPTGTYPVRVGLYFEPSSWDGSDLFVSSSEVAWVFVTERIVRAFKRAKVTNAKFEPLDEFEVPA
jgi:hypothetical protein